MKSTLFHTVYDACTAQFNGAFVPAVAAKMIAERSGLDAAVVEAALTSPTVFLYPDVVPTLDQILKRPNVLPVLWTEGQVTTESGENGYQVQKFLASGLRHRYTAWDTAAAMGLMTILGGPVKAEMLPRLQGFVATHRLTQIVVVDDNPAQLVAADRWLAEGATAYRLLHLDRSPNAYTYLLNHIQRIHHLQEVVPLLRDPGLHVILFDLDYTLIDHAQTREEMSERVETMLANRRR